VAVRRSDLNHGLVDELQRGHRATVSTIAVMLLLSLLSSWYLLAVCQPNVAAYTELTRESRRAHEAMLNQETGLRGWLATGDRVFLEPYANGRTVAEDATQQLVRQSSISPRLSAVTLRMLLTRQQWQSWARVAATKRVSETDRTEGRLTAFLLQGKALFDDYRTADQRTARLITTERDRSLATERLALIGVLVAQLATLSAATLLAVRRRRRLERDVVRPLHELQGTITSLRSGDLTARSEPSGVAELDDVGNALTALAADLGLAGEEATAREARLELLAARFATVVRVARETSGSLSVRYVSEAVTNAAADLLGCSATIWIRSGEGPFRIVVRSTDSRGPTPRPDPAPPRVVATAAAEARPSDDGSVRAYPLLLAGNVVGVLEVDTREIDDDARQVLEALLSTAAAALESARLHSSARELAYLDALTQLPNRRRLETDLASEWERCLRYGRPLSFVMIDLDHFKRLNDQHGHLVGDAVLSSVAATLSASLRGSDTAYRYGGEELVLLLRETGVEEATVVAERLRLALSELQVPGTTARVTASMGVAERSPDMLDQSELVARADSALYGAKRGGRDRVAAAA
jgi:diguanylate cyclase (GGDEF)-like protein